LVYRDDVIFTRAAVIRGTIAAFCPKVEVTGGRGTMNTHRWLKPGAAAVLALALCIGASIEPAQAAWRGVVVVAPPAPVVETIGVAPAPGYVWLGGYWDWVGGRHVWVPGRWAPPRPGYHWVPHGWVHGPEGYRLHPGHWARG
jgi:hypothetical protein